MPAFDFECDGYAIGVSGFIDGLIPTQLVAGIPPAGGSSVAESKHLAARDVVFVSRGVASANGKGQPLEGGWESFVGVELERCRIFDRITLDHLTLRLRSAFPRDSRWPRFEAFSSSIEGLSIDGNSIDVKLDGFIEYGNRRRFPGSLASEISSREAGLQIAGSTITIPQFGKVRVADVSVKRDRVRLVMLAVELDSNIRGHLELASGNLGYSVRDLGESLQERTEAPIPEPPTVELDEYELEGCMAELRLWANNHPAPREPFLALMGRVLTPLEFLFEVEARSRIGNIFLVSLAEQFKDPADPPRKFIARSAEANQR
jgi:hypothetical protein